MKWAHRENARLAAMFTAGAWAFDHLGLLQLAVFFVFVWAFGYTWDVIFAIGKIALDLGKRRC